MSDSTCLASDPTTVLSWVSSRGIEIRNHATSAAIASADPPEHPVLHLLAPGVQPPLCTPLEDWIRCPYDIDELKARADRLLARSHRLGAALVCMHADDTLHVGDDIVILSEQEARLMSCLVDRLGELVLREDLVAEVWPEGPPQDPRALDNRLKSLRRHLAAVPLQIHTIWGRGFLLERTISPPQTLS